MPTPSRYRRLTPATPVSGNPAAGTAEKEDHGPAVSARSALADPEGATTHGLFARDIVLTHLGEDPDAYEALLTLLCEQIAPRNLLERHYLEQIAAASWRLRRLHRWQAQVYEDPALTEDQRLDRLEKTLRHETTLTRQIDRAVRTLNRDLKWLFESRARDEALYQRDLTEAEVRAEPDLGIEVQRLVWSRLRPAPPPDPGDARPDNTPHTTQKCENEPAPTPPPNATPPNTTPTPPELGAGGPPQHDPHEKCENEPAPPTRREGRLDPDDYIAYRKREQEIYRKHHPHAPPDNIDWDSEELQHVYGTPARRAAPAHGRQDDARSTPRGR